MLKEKNEFLVYTVIQSKRIPDYFRRRNMLVS